MPDKLEKFRRKLDAKRRVVLDEVLAQIARGNFAGLDMKKLGGKDSRYRVRKGNMRIQFSLDNLGRAIEFDVHWKDDTTYRS